MLNTHSRQGICTDKFSTMKDEDINLTYRNIIGKSCILIIGPDLIAKHSQNEGLFENFIEYLRAEKDNLGLKNIDLDNLYDEDGFFNIDKKNSRDFDILKNKLQAFCEKCSENFTDLYSKIAQIPFHLTFFTSPDIALKTAMDKMGIENKFYSYNPKESTGSWQLKTMPKDNTPVLINLVAEYDANNFVRHMVLSYEDFITLIAKLYGDNQLPDSVQGAIKSAKQIIFMGYRFDKWYAKIICDLFNFPSPHEREGNKNNIAILKRSIVKGEVEMLHGEPEIISAQPFKFYERQYNTAFEHLDPEEFIDRLYKKFTPAQLRRNNVDDFENAPPLQRLAREVLKAVEAGDLREGMMKLNEFQTLSDDVEYQKTISTFKSEYNREKKEWLRRPRDTQFDEISGISKDSAKDLSNRIIDLMNDFLNGN